DLAHQHLGIDHHARTEHAELAGMQHAGRHEVQDRLLTAHAQRVAGVVAAVVSHHEIGVGREQVDDLALPFVTPLGAYDYGSRHAYSQSSRSSADTTCGSVRSCASTASDTGSSTWKSDSAMPPTCSRPSSRPAMLILFSPRSVPTRPTTPGTSWLWSRST